MRFTSLARTLRCVITFCNTYQSVTCMPHLSFIDSSNALWWLTFTQPMGCVLIVLEYHRKSLFQLPQVLLFNLGIALVCMNFVPAQRQVALQRKQLRVLHVIIMILINMTINKGHMKINYLQQNVIEKIVKVINYGSIINLIAISDNRFSHCSWYTNRSNKRHHIVLVFHKIFLHP